MLSDQGKDGKLFYIIFMLFEISSYLFSLDNKIWSLQLNKRLEFYCREQDFKSARLTAIIKDILKDNGGIVD